MNLPFTRTQLINWAGEQVVRDAEALVDRGLVLEAELDDPTVRGIIRWNSRDLKTSMTLESNGLVDNHCPCYANVERGVICSHVIALAVSLIRRKADPTRELQYREEARRATRLAAIKEHEYIQRVPADTAGATPATIRIELSNQWPEAVALDRIGLTLEAEIRGKRIPLDQVPKNVPIAFSKRDEALLYVLDDISEGPARGSLQVNRADFINILSLHRGRTLDVAGGGVLEVQESKLVTHVQLDLDHENGELILLAQTEVPGLSEAEFPTYVVSGNTGWVYGAGGIWPLEKVLPGPYHSIYNEAAIVQRPDVLKFFRYELPAIEKQVSIETSMSLDLFIIDPAEPTFTLSISGSAASLSAVLTAGYGTLELVVGRRDPLEHFAIPDEADILRYLVRDRETEKAALQIVAQHGLRGEYGDSMTSIVGKRNVLHFLGSSVPALRRLGWKIEMQGRIAPMMDDIGFATPVVRVSDQGVGGWFDIGFEFEAPDGNSLNPSDIQRALARGESFVEYKGKPLLIDEDAILSMRDVFADCATGDSDIPGHFRMAELHAPYVKASLDSLDGVDVEDTPTWRRRAAEYNRTQELTPPELPDDIASILRPYQLTGIAWLIFLETHGFCGILADEMGLGKTLQTLAWIQHSASQKQDDEPRKPTLIVCPTSIVENWAAEATKFVPGLSVQIMSGPDRHDLWPKLPEVDIVITSYALLRRDLKKYLDLAISAVVLDEAQHIKNRSTQNAVAAKKLRADHRLVLTGTPVENSVTDLWSIMDFLMPGYLGEHDTFRNDYELPISRGGPEGISAQKKLRRKLHPFLLRRLKTEVARDLPPKIEKLSSCALTTDQKTVYNELLQRSKRRISDMVSKQGFNKCRMEILTTLMRLRQICCHLDLLDLPDLKSKQPSGKMELFFELLDEALDGGHRVLVFSQFVSMLKILRKQLDSRKIDYCYLDGSTKERLQVVHKFNTQRSIPVFLISLKAGGTGLNLTGADMVIHFDPWWNPAVENQATDRAYRIGQKRTVYSIKLITAGTVEEKVLELQRRKQAVIDATIENDEGVMQKLEWEDVQELLSL